MRTFTNSLATLVALTTLCASATASAQVVQLNRGFTPDPVTLRGVAGGPVSGTAINPSCRGNFPARPQHRIVTNGINPLRIFTMAANNADVTLAVVAPNRSVFCDDDGGDHMQALLNLPLGPGAYDVYVGSFSASETPQYNLVLTTNQSLNPDTFRPGNVAIVQTNPTNGTAPNPNVRSNPTPNTGTLQRAASLRPTGPAIRLRNGGSQRARGRTGGSVSTATLLSTCNFGFITTEPSHIVTLDRPASALEFTVTSASDTTLLVLGPNGSAECNDDREQGNFNPRLLFDSAPAGTYTVWVGTFNQGARNLYQLNATTNPR